MSTIVRARLLEAALPLREPFAISGGVMSVRRSLIVALQDASGRVGYGESAPFEFPFYSSETVASAAVSLRELLLPRVVGRDFSHPQPLNAALRDGVRGHAFARAGIETAWWDLEARRRETSLAALVGERLAELGVPEARRRTGSRVTCGVALGIPAGESVEELRRAVREAVGEGYHRVKLKVRPGWAVEPVRAALAELRGAARSIPLWVDANGSFDPEEDRDELAELRRQEILFVEQPFPPDGWWDSAVAERESGAPLCLDESLTSDSVARQVLGAGGPRIWNLKVQRLGGLDETCRVYARGVGAGVQLWVGTMPETGLGAQAALAVASLAGIAFPTDVEPSARWYGSSSDLISLHMDGDGTMAVPGCSPEPDLTSVRMLSELS